MCGISGIIYNKSPKQTEKFKLSANLQSHRGPDYTGYFGDQQVDLVHHRLSILDLDPRAHQPFCDKQKNRLLIYNGEIYNYRELSKKYDFSLSTSSDTEVLFQLLDKPEFTLKELNGIFAFAEYRVKEKTLQLTRDRLGVKPLYYYHNEKYFMFASEAKVIYDFLEELEVDEQALSEFLTFGHSNGEQTIIKKVKKLKPGYTLTLDIENFSIKESSYWSVETFVHQQIKPGYLQAKNTTTKLLENAVERQCASDVTVGAYLSGGIDSSAVVAFASRYTGQKLKTYSVNFDKSPKSELKQAQKVAKAFKTEHYEFEVNTTGFDDILSHLIYQYDEPFADPAMIPLHFIAEKASTSSKVVLQGDGGDEVFAGYGRHLDLQQYHYRKTSFKLLQYVGLTSKSRAGFAKRYHKLNAKTDYELMAGLVERDVNNLDLDVFKPQIKEKLKTKNPLRGYQQSDKCFRELPLMQRMLYTDVQNILQHKYLEKVDKVNMYHAIEARVPFLDNELIDYIMRLPQNYKIKKGITKYLLRDVLTGTVPDDILNAKKQSFGTPISAWLSTTLYDYALDHFQKARKHGLALDYNMLIQHLQNLKLDKPTMPGTMLWKYLVLTVWLSFYRHKIKNLS